MHWDRDTAETLAEQEDRTLRDVHDRCVTCGRPPSEACCDTCHRVHRALWNEVVEDRSQRGSLKAMAIRAIEVNTEAVNQ